MPGPPSLLIWREGEPHWQRVWRPNAVFIFRGLGLQGRQCCRPDGIVGQPMMSPSSGCAAPVFFHQRGKSWVALWWMQRSAALYTRRGKPLAKASRSATLSSSAHAEVHASSSHGMFPREEGGSLERSGEPDVEPLSRGRSARRYLSRRIASANGCSSR